MRTSSWGTGTPLDHLHRVGAVVFGLGLAGFGILGLWAGPEMFSTTGPTVLGMSSNGLLAVISIAVGTVLVAAGISGGRRASTILVIAGAAFVLSGLVNTLVLGTSLNLLAFQMSNVVFSFVAGALLLFLGAWGRFTGRLPDDNPYRQERHHDEGPDALPTTFHDQVVVFVTATGMYRGRLTERVYARTIYHRTIYEENWSAIQITTAAGICGVLDLLLEGKLPQAGLVRQEEVDYEQFIKNRFGRWYVAERPEH